jgi:hypothetical protein
MLEKAGYTVDDVDLVVPHQANQRITDAVASTSRRAGRKSLFKHRRTRQHFVGFDSDCARRMHSVGQNKEGDLVLLTAFGGGATWGATDFRLLDLRIFRFLLEIWRKQQNPKSKIAYIFPGQGSQASEWERIYTIISPPRAKFSKKPTTRSDFRFRKCVFRRNGGRFGFDGKHAARDFDDFDCRFSRDGNPKVFRRRIMSPVTVWANIRLWSRRARLIFPTR